MQTEAKDSSPDLRVGVRKIHFPERCASCGKKPETTASLSGTTRRQGKLLLGLLAGAFVVTIAYAAMSEDAVATVIDVLGTFARLGVAYLLYYFVFLNPALTLFRSCRREGSRLRSVLSGALLATVWLCMAFFGPIAADGDDTAQNLGLVLGLFLTLLFAVYVTGRVTIRVPVCSQCRKTVGEALQVTDYSPRQHTAVFHFRDSAYARDFAQSNAGDFVTPTR